MLRKLGEKTSQARSLGSDGGNPSSSSSIAFDHFCTLLVLDQMVPVSVTEVGNFFLGDSSSLVVLDRRPVASVTRVGCWFLRSVAWRC